MTDKKHLESILKVNGLGATSPDEEIRSVLMSARFDNDEVDTALMILRENVKTSETRVDGLHKVFRTDKGLQPAEVSRLLGINIEITDPITLQNRRKHLTTLEFFLLCLVSVLLATVCAMIYMYTNHIGLFHPSAEPIITFVKST